jgi:two-component system cell cycle sensor histidine kinase/response regulator CckA
MNYRSIIIFFTITICVLLAFVVNVVYGIDIVYTHLFYIPIILTGIWYPGYAIFCAAAMGITHIACDYATIEAFKIGSFLRAVMFMVVAYVTSYLALRRNKILNSLRESEAALKQSHDELEQQVAERTKELIRVNEELQTDITERKLMEEALQESEIKFRTIFNNSVDAIGVSKEGIQTFMNPAYLSLFGYSSTDELINRPVLQLITPAEHEIILTRIRSHAKGEVVHSQYETRGLRKDGTEFDMDVHVSIYELAGETCSLVILRDITERKRTEQEMILLADIGRMIGSTLQIDEVYDSVTNMIRNLIPIDSLTVNLCDARQEMMHVAYVSGLDMPGRRVGDVFSLQGSLAEEVIRTKRGALCQSQNPEGLVEKFPRLITSMKAGIRSVMSVPLISMDKVIGNLIIRSKKPVAFTEQDLRFAEKIGMQIAGAMANAELFNEHKRAEDELRESEERFRTIFEEAHQGIVITAPSFVFVKANPAFCRMMGYPEDELRSMTFADITHPDHLIQDMENVKKVGRGEIPFYQTEKQYINKSGEELWGNLIVSSIRDENGALLYYLSMVNNITERKRAEEVLREKERMLSETQQISHIGSWTVTLNSMQSQWSDESYRIFGVTPERFVLTPESFLGFIYSDDRPTMEKWIQDCTTGQHPPELEFRVIRPDGNIRFLCGRGYLSSAPDSTPLRLVGSVQDVTDRKHAEEEKRGLEERLQRAEKMEALGQLAGGVAHDLNNVLGVLSGYSELLIEKIPADNPLRKYAENIFKSTEKGAAIIQDLLTLARRGVVVSQVVDINGIVSNFLSTMEFGRMKDYHPGVIFRTELEKDVLNIKGSPVHLEKTVMNLLSNAAEAISGAGEVMIRTENRYLDKAVRGYDHVNEGDYVVLSVSDTGRGIPPDDLNKIFEPFYTKKKMGRSGTGLGLTIVWGTVKDHDGYIDVKSEEGKGTVFTLYFPVTREKMADKAKKIPVEEYMGHGESVLVVDDVEGQRMVATALLMELGYRVHAVPSGEEAVDYLRGNKADILVLDMIMDPGIDGLETYRRILKINPYQRAIIVSGFSETDRVRETQRLGAGAYVKKPYVTEKIGVAIREELARNR